MAEEKEKKKITKKTSTVDKWRKKKWFKIHASQEFDKKVIGETLAEKPKQLENRKIQVSLGNLTNQRQKRHITVVFAIKEVQGQDAFTGIDGHFISNSFINRFVRRKNSRMQTVQTVTTKDGVKIKIKAVIVSGRKLERKQETAIRKIMADRIEKSVGRKDFSQTIQEIVFGVLAAKLFKEAKKIAQLKRSEITKSQVIEGK